ncbi:MAG: ATP-binding cassette domain-containing protein [Atopobiaceae bacterium]|nr:ATP-binding cassette domain-containing protein [Atopobiaceae bacterium]
MPLTCRNLSLSYGARRVLAGVDLDVAPGRVLGVAGASGSGKTSLLRCLAGLERGYDGSVAVDGLGERASVRGREWHACVGLVGQGPERQLFARTVFDDVAFGPNNLGLPDDEVLGRVTRALGAVGLDLDWSLERSPLECSGGEQRAVAIAGVLALQTPYLLLDEPTAGLDAARVEELVHLVRSLAEKGVGVALVSHDMEVLARASDEVAVLADGQVAYEGVPYLVFRQEGVLRRAGLEAPGLLRVAYALERAGRACGLARVPYDSLAGAILDAVVPGERRGGECAAGAGQPAGAGQAAAAGRPTCGARPAGEGA